MTKLRFKKLTKKEKRLMKKFGQMAWKRPAQFSKWYDSISDSERDFLDLMKRNAHLNPHLFDLSKVDEVKGQLAKEYYEDFG